MDFALSVFSVLIFVFAVHEGLSYWRELISRFWPALQNHRASLPEMILISLPFAVKLAIGAGPAGYYGLHLLSELGGKWLA